LLISENLITGNSANQGGGLYLISSKFAASYLSTLKFERNIGRSSGGGMSAVASQGNYPTANVQIAGIAYFRDNEAGLGAGIFVQGQESSKSMLDLRGGKVRIERNSAQVHGGGIAVLFYAILHAENVTFDSNLANLGGGLYCSQCTATIISCVFNNNSAANYGGAIALYNSPPILFCNQTVFSENTAVVGGGAIAGTSDAYVGLNSCTLTSNTQVMPKPCAAYCGGAGIYAAESAVVEMTGGVLRNNSAVYGSGGGVLAQDSSSIRMREVGLDSNQATGFGGGIATRDLASAVLDGLVIIEDNFAASGGGAIFAGGVLTQLDTALIRGNQAEDIGGGILFYGTVQIETGVSFLGNRASDGGGLFGSGKNARFILRPSASVSFQNNSALVNGGAMYLEDSASYEIRWDDCPSSCSGIIRRNGICDLEW
jgi:predicted outer membrane repeat protein